MSQIFRLLARAWDIDAANRILEKSPREAQLVDIWNALPWIRTKQSYVDTIDLEKADPIIIGTITTEEGDFWLPIDGWHRIKRAKDLGVHKLPAYILTKKETKKVEIR